MGNETDSSRDAKRTLTELELVSEQLADWRMLIDRLHASFDTGDFVGAVKLVDAITQAAEEMDHHPDLDLAYGRLDVRLISHDVGGVTSRDVVLARTISELARAVGATPRPERISVLELGLDTADEAEIRPFWAALLDYDTVEAWGRSNSATLPGVSPRSGSSAPRSTTFHDSAGMTAFSTSVFSIWARRLAAVNTVSRSLPSVQ